MSDAELRSFANADDGGVGALKCSRGRLPLQALDVQARVVGTLSEVEPVQTFVNSFADGIEATYIFPLPSRAAVSHFRLEVAGRVVDGVLDERARACERYETALLDGHRAAIAEEERAGTFTLRVGNLMPGEVVKVYLGLTGPLPYHDGEVTFRFPLVVAPRYTPGTPLPGVQAGTGTGLDTDAAPDASRITPPVFLPGRPTPVQLSLVVDVSGGDLPLTNLRSSLHAVTETHENGLLSVVLQPGERLDRDFILRWQLGSAAVQTSALVFADESGPGSTLLLTIAPPIGLERGRRPRDVVFVLDRSASMARPHSGARHRWASLERRPNPATICMGDRACMLC